MKLPSEKDDSLDGPVALRCQFDEVIKKPTFYKDQFVRLIGRVEEYDPVHQMVTVSDPLLVTRETLVVNVSKIINSSIFKNDIYSFFGELKQVNGCHILEALFVTNCSSINVHQLLTTEKTVMDYINQQLEPPPGKNHHFMDVDEDTILELF